MIDEKPERSSNRIIYDPPSRDKPKGCLAAAFSIRAGGGVIRFRIRFHVRS
jgi:hypothetical protein